MVWEGADPLFLRVPGALVLKLVLLRLLPAFLFVALAPVPVNMAAEFSVLITFPPSNALGPNIGVLVTLLKICRAPQTGGKMCHIKLSFPSCLFSCVFVEKRADLPQVLRNPGPLSPFRFSQDLRFQTVTVSSRDQTGKGILVDITSPGYFLRVRQGAEPFLCT